MKRDLNLIREILLSIEEYDDVKVDCPDDKLAYHILLLNEREYVAGIVAVELINGPIRLQQTLKYVRLTDAGHNYLDAVRDDTIWKKTKDKMSEVGGAVSLDIVVTIATMFIKEKLGIS